MERKRLLVIETHPVQYHAPVLQEVERLGVSVTAAYGSDFSVVGYRDREFGTEFAWDTDLLAGYTPCFLSRIESGGPTNPESTSARGLGSILDKVKPDATMVMGYSPGFYRYALLQIIARRYPLLFRAETTDHANRRSAAKTIARDAFLKLLYSRCEKLLYIGRHSHDHYKRLGITDEKLVFSPYCVDASAFRYGEADRRVLRDRTRCELAIPSDAVVLLFSGKLVARKGPDLLIEAIKRLTPETRNRIVVIFLGDGQEGETLQHRARGDINVAVRFAGFHNQRELSPFYHAADLMVLPSRALETWGLVVNEALHHGVPAVVTRQVGCAPDLILSGTTGEIAEEPSPESLTRAIAQSLAWLSDSPRIRERCRAHVANYSVSRAAQGIVAAFESMASRRQCKTA
jgi:glycosyltransferase involved in cell wall biosynthesis